MRNGFSLAASLEQAAVIEADLTSLLAGLTESQFHAPPRSGGWSIALSLEHLILTGEAVMLARHQSSLNYSWLERARLFHMDPPVTLKRKAPEWATPFARRSMEDTQRRFLKMHRELTERVQGFSLDLALAHERRHLWQAWKLRKRFTESKETPVTLAK